MKRNWSIAIAVLISVLGLALVLTISNYKSAQKVISPSINDPRAVQTDNNSKTQNQYPIHSSITATTFWIGEPASSSNSFISNTKSAWDENWQSHYGGVDSPNNRIDFYPSGFTPKENPFYFALPYNDFNSNGDRKKDAYKIIYWAGQNTWDPAQSMLKNQWIKVTKNGRSVYAQWEDVGPYGEDDSDYVFGSSAPKSIDNSNAGIDLSPSVNDYLHLNGEDKVDWQFVEEADVPSGPWKDIVTTS